LDFAEEKKDYLRKISLVVQPVGSLMSAILSDLSSGEGTEGGAVVLVIISSDPRAWS